jgi:hypothetical protein
MVALSGTYLRAIWFEAFNFKDNFEIVVEKKKNYEMK